MSGCGGCDYLIGQGVRLKANFQDNTGRLADPTTIQVRVGEPDGTVTTYNYGTDAALVRDSTGAYHIDLDLEEDGCWTYVWQSSGAIQAVTEGTFNVSATPI